MNQIDKIIETAERYIGIKENPPNSNNVVFNTRYYGKAVSGSAYPWCCAFIWCLFQDIGAPELFYGGGKTASCTTLMNYAKQKGLFHTAGFQRGDLALFDFDNDRTKSEHIGIIEQVKPDSVVTIEGNTSLGNNSDGGEVMRRARNNNLIIGVYRPAYAEDKTESEDDNMPRYNTLAEVPEWGRPTVKKLIDKKAIKGSGKKDENGDPADMNLSEDMVRLLVWDDRMELYV